MKKYKATKPLGRFKEGDFVGGLSDAEIAFHLISGNVVAETVASPKPKAKDKGDVDNG